MPVGLSREQQRVAREDIARFLISLVAGVFGIVVVGIPFLQLVGVLRGPIGSRESVGLMISVGVPTLLVALLLGTARSALYLRHLKKADYVLAFIGSGAVVFREGIYRSADGLRQFRYAVGDSRYPGPVARPRAHLERLEGEDQFIRESYEVDIARLRRRTALGIRRPGIPRVVEYAVVQPQSLGGPRVTHFVGKPPEASHAGEPPRQLPFAKTVILEQRDEGAFLWRFASDGRYAGDTWHETLDDARWQASFEYGDSLGEWQQVPREPSGDLGLVLAQWRRPGSLRRWWTSRFPG